MKKLFLLLVVLAILATSCDNFIVIKRDPTVLNSTISLSGEITGDMDSLARTMHMRVTGQAGNFLLVEIFGMETYSNTESISVLDSLSGTNLFLTIVDEGILSAERSYRNAQFWVGPFEKDEIYSLHLTEAESAFKRDSLQLQFTYYQALDQSVSAEGYYYLLSEAPFGSVSVRNYNSQEIPDFNHADYVYNINSLKFFDTDSGLLIRSILDLDCDVTHAAAYEISGDTLFMNITLGPAGITGCNKLIFFDYLIEDYAEQSFYYQFYLTNGDWAKFEGLWQPPRVVWEIEQ